MLLEDKILEAEENKGRLHKVRSDDVFNMDQGLWYPKPAFVPRLKEGDKAVFNDEYTVAGLEIKKGASGVVTRGDDEYDNTVVVSLADGITIEMPVYWFDRQDQSNVLAPFNRPTI